jgi:membrane-bound serine protease (ClpP class)
LRRRAGGKRGEKKLAWATDFIMGFSWMVTVCLITGVVRLVIEGFTPGFGVAGIMVLLFLVASIIFRADTVQNALIMLALVILIFGLLFVLFVRSAAKGRLSRSRFVLKESIQEDAARIAGDQAGQYIGRQGRTLSDLRPAGGMVLDGKRLDVVSEGEYIDKGKTVTIVRVEGPRVVVREELEKQEINQ